MTMSVLFWVTRILTVVFAVYCLFVSCLLCWKNDEPEPYAAGTNQIFFLLLGTLLFLSFFIATQYAAVSLVLLFSAYSILLGPARDAMEKFAYKK